MEELVLDFFLHNSEKLQSISQEKYNLCVSCLHRIIYLHSQSLEENVGTDIRA